MMDPMTAVFWLVYVGTAALTLYVAEVYRREVAASD